MIKKDRGNITVFLAIFLPFFFLLLGALVDIVSMKYASNILKETLYGSCDSLLSQYNKSLRDQYSLFALADTVEFYKVKKLYC